jgi:hypothetical protein
MLSRVYYVDKRTCRCLLRVDLKLSAIGLYICHWLDLDEDSLKLMAILGQLRG